MKFLHNTNKITANNKSSPTEIRRKTAFKEYFRQNGGLMMQNRHFKPISG